MAGLGPAIHVFLACDVVNAGSHLHHRVGPWTPPSGSTTPSCRRSASSRSGAATTGWATANGRAPTYPERVYIAIYTGPKPEAGSRRHWCFKAKSRTEVDAFWDAGIAAGGSDDGPPGLRDYHPSYYAAFLRDPDGNRVEAVCHHAV